MDPLLALLADGNVTPRSRTPWGGTRIGAVLKQGRVPGMVGEAWEFSAGPEFPSRLESGELLRDYLRGHPEWLGLDAPQAGPSLLVKLLEAAEPLSVQIHPRDSDPVLAPGESGKPEAWYVEHAEPGAGLWIGWAATTSQQSAMLALRSGADFSEQLAFHPVVAGDVFMVPACTPHAIGAGVTLVEPQRVAPGRRGVTYRYWDWNRRYDTDGRASSQGMPRELHLERALQISAWGGPRGEDFTRSVRHRPGPPTVGGEARCELLLGGDAAPLRSDALWMWRLAGHGGCRVEPFDRIRAVTVLSGELRAGGITVCTGRTAVLAAGAELDCEMRMVHAIVAAAQ